MTFNPKKLLGSRMTIDIKELERLLAEATPEPWQVEQSLNEKDYVRIIGGIDGDAYDDGSPRGICTHVVDVLDNNDEQANAALIVAAVNALPELLAERKRHIEALGNIARQNPSKRIDPEEGGDFQDAYDTMIEIAQAALKGTPS